jgi:hypothetical protein
MTTSKAAPRSSALQLARRLFRELAPNLVMLLVWALISLTSTPASWAAGVAMGIELVRLEEAYARWKIFVEGERAVGQLRALAEIREAFARTAP